MRKIYISAKEGLRSVPFHLFNEEYNRIKAENDGDTSDAWPKYLKQKDHGWLVEYSIAAFADMIYPQLFVYLAKHKLNRNEDGKICGHKYWEDNIDTTSDWELGLVRFLKINPRALTMSKPQYRPPANQYNALVPIVLAAHKKYNDVPYSDWSRETLRSVVYPDLAEAMLYEHSNNFSTEELISIRNNGLYVASGPRIGTSNSAVTTYPIYRAPSEFSLIPVLAQRMLLQTWCAHPLNRTKYTVVDPDDWDNMPEPLVDAEVIIQVEKSKPVKPKLVDNDYPW